MKKNSFYTIGSLIILLLCAFVFVLLPAFSGGDRGNQLPAFGKYNGKEIRYEQNSDFANFVSNYGQMIQNYGQQISASTYYYIYDQAFKSTVMKMAYTDAVKKSGYTIPESAINRQMLPYFSDENGNYSSKLYKQTPESTITNLRKDVTSNLYSTRFYEDTFGSNSETIGQASLYGIKESEAELNFLKDFDSTKRGFKMAVFNLNDYPESMKIAFGKENASKFVKYDLSAITVSDSGAAKDILSRINANEITFEDAISEYSTKNYTNTEGKLTYKWQYQIETHMLTDKADIEKLAALKEGEMTEAIPTSNGYAIFKANAAAVQPDFTSADMVTTVSQYLAGYESSVMEDYFTAKANEFTAEAMKTSFDKACTKLDVTKVDIPAFPLNYGNEKIAGTLDTSLTALANADTNENFLKTAFGLQLNEYSTPLVMNSNVVVLQYTTEEKADETAAASVPDLTNYDGNAALDVIMNSSKLKNNFSSVYFKYFDTNNN